jgi:LDH2 family malate/lactate/ureidoglycolate dehydrogenase
MSEITLNYSDLYQFCVNVLTTCGLAQHDSTIAADVLLDADLKGVDSHGVARLSGYVRLINKQRINLKANFRITSNRKSVAVMDADSGLGLLSAPFAMQIAIEKAKNTGCGFVAINNSNHFGIAGHHSEIATQYDMIGFALTNASPLVAPTFSVDRMLGTNPIAYSFPMLNDYPITADLATTSAANGKLEILQRKNKQAPIGWLQDKQGHSSIDPFELSKGGAILPLGSDYEHGSHKGYCLGAVVDIFSGVLSGANFGPWVPPFVAFLEPRTDLVGKGIGHFVGAWDVEAFMEKEEYFKRLHKWKQAFKSAKPISEKQPVLVPGEIEHETKKIRMSKGIPLIMKVVDDLTNLAKELNIDHPF